MKKEKTVASTPHLNYLAGCLREAKRDLAAAERNVYKLPAETVAAMIEQCEVEVKMAEIYFQMEFNAMSVLESLDAKKTPVPVEPELRVSNGDASPLLTVAAPVVTPADNPEPVVQPTPEPAKTQPGRCPHWKEIKRFFAIAREYNLDTSKAAKPRMRHAMETVMGRCVDSRSEVTASEWQRLGDAVKSKALRW